MNKYIYMESSVEDDIVQAGLEFLEISKRATRLHKEVCKDTLSDENSSDSNLRRTKFSSLIQILFDFCLTFFIKKVDKKFFG